MSLSCEIGRLALELGNTAFERICARLESAPTGVTASSALAGLDDELAPWIVSALRSISASEPRPDVLALMLRCAEAGAHGSRQTLGKTDLVWSGPDAGVPAMHSLEQALRDIILRAESEVWLVSFAAFRIPHLLAALREIAQRGVRLSFLLETAGDSDGALAVDARAAFPADLLSGVRLYTWPLENRPRNTTGRPAKLHAKFAIADRQAALISSANLTPDALERNMEAGVVVRGGPIPSRLTDHLEHLVTNGIIAQTF